MKTKRGRKCKLTPELQRQLCRVISLPCTIRSACEACGISESSFNDWLRRGETGEQPFSEFLTAVMRARGVGKVKIVESILDSDDARVKLEYLARVYPEEFARTTERKLPVVPETPQPRNIIINVVSNEETERSVARFGERPAHLLENAPSSIENASQS